MTLTVKFMGPVLRPGAAQGKDEVAMELGDGAVVSDLLLSLGYHKSHVRTLGVFQDDGRRMPVGESLVDGDVVTITVPFGGG